MSRQSNITIAVFIDAVGWEIARRYGFLAQLLPRQKQLETVFGYSSTCEPTILTGVAPRDHGHFAFYAYAPERSPFQRIEYLSWLPDFLTERGRIRRQISKFVQWRLGVTGYFQLYNVPFSLLPELDYTERRDLYQPGGIIGGQTTLFDDLRDLGTSFHLSDWRKGERENLYAAKTSVRSGRPRFAYIFLAELDAILHAEGTDAVTVGKKLRWYERELTDLVSIAKKEYEQVSVVVFSDHGMTNIRSEFNLMRVIGQLPLQVPQDYFAVYDSTMARFWFRTPLAERMITAELECHKQGRWLTKDDLARWGCDFLDQRYGQQFYLLNPGILLNPSFMGRTTLKGMHGFAPDDKDSIAFFATNDLLMALPDSLMDLRRVLTASLNVRQGEEVCV